MYVISSETIEYEHGEITITLVPDEDPSPPDGDSSVELEFFRAERGDHLRAKMGEEFEDPTEAGNTMVSGEVYSQDGDWYWGVSEYRHGQSALALCGSTRANNFPDREWDVLSLVGWIKVSKKLREDWGIGDDKDKALANAKGTLEMWEAYLNGNVFGYIVRAYDAENNELEDDSCWGYYFEDDALTDAKTAAAYLAGKYCEALGDLKT